MKKLILILTVVTVAGLMATGAWAQPFGTQMGADTYGIAQGGTNILTIPTPRDDNDNPAGKNLDINDAINLLLSTSYAHNSDVDFLRHTGQDSIWTDLSDKDNSGTFVFLGLTAANTNTLRVYDVATPGTKIKVLPSLSGFDFTGDGSAAHPFLAGFSPFSPGTNFGWNLKSTTTSSVTSLWDSNPAFNPGGYDHMLTYDLAKLAGKTVYIKSCSNINNSTTCTIVSTYTFNHPYLLGFEDKPCVTNTNGDVACGDEDYDDTMFLVDRVAPIVPEPLSLMLLGSGLFGFAGMRRKRN